jgi:hypothetical protein
MRKKPTLIQKNGDIRDSFGRAGISKAKGEPGMTRDHSFPFQRRCAPSLGGGFDVEREKTEGIGEVLTQIGLQANA